MKRRTFLRTTTTAAGAMIAGAGLPLFNHLEEIPPALAHAPANHNPASTLTAKSIHDQAASLMPV